VLVFSIHEPFRTLLHNSLNSSGFGQSSAAGEVEEVRRKLKEGNFETLVLDLDADEDIQQALLQLIQDVQPAHLIVFPPDNDRLHPLVKLLRPASVLIKPFYLPDLLLALQEELPPSSRPADLLDMGMNAAHPERLLDEWLNEAKALGVVVLRSGEPPMLAGTLQEEDLREAALVLGRFWQSERRSDLIRYFRPHLVDKDVLLYATLLPDGQPLGLVFDAHTSLREARRLSQWFAGRWNEVFKAISSVKQKAAKVDEADFRTEGETGRVEDEFSFDEEETAEEFEQIRLEDILGSIPPPDPLQDKKLFSDDWKPEEGFVADFVPPLLLVKAVMNSSTAGREPPVSVENPAALEETRPSRKTQTPPPGGELTLENRQSYTCILLPRSPQVVLEGQIVEELRRWLPDFCATLGYTLESVEVQPQYFMWTVNLPPAVSPGHLVRMIKEKSSTYLAESIPALAGKGNFWASAHLILRSRKTPESALIEDFILRTRRRQGFLSS